MRYDKNYIAGIIIKNEHDACSSEELLILEKWYQSLDDNTQQLDAPAIQDLVKNKIWSEITSKIDAKENEAVSAKVVPLHTKRNLFFFARIAAVLILIVGGYTAYNWQTGAKQTDTIKYISKVNTTGKPMKIILPDKSLIWLETKSSISYPDHFTKNRVVFMDSGKAFFNIAHDASKPFIVESTNGLKATVLGTAFVLEKKSGEHLFKISVFRGKVEVSDNSKKYATLTKNQGVNVNFYTKAAALLAVDSVEMTKWFVAKVALDNVTLHDVAISIKETLGYNVKFSSASLASKPCSITYNETDNVEDILLLLDKIYHTSHSISDSTIKINDQ